MYDAYDDKETLPPVQPFAYIKATVQLHSFQRRTSVTTIKQPGHLSPWYSFRNSLSWPWRRAPQWSMLRQGLGKPPGTGTAARAHADGLAKLP
jgi:hypothetical protein